MPVLHCSCWTAQRHRWRFDEMIHSIVQDPVKLANCTHHQCSMWQVSSSVFVVTVRIKGNGDYHTFQMCFHFIKLKSFWRLLRWFSPTREPDFFHGWFEKIPEPFSSHFISKKKWNPYLSNKKQLLFHCCVSLPYEGKRTPKICQRITPYKFQFTYRFYLMKEDEANTKCSEILNLLFGVLVDNKRGYSPHCSKNTTQLVQHPRILSAKTPNKVYVSPSTCQTQGLVERLGEVVGNDKNGRYRKKTEWLRNEQKWPKMTLEWHAMERKRTLCT